MTAPDPAVWPAVSVVMPVRDEARAALAAVASVFAQDYPAAVEVVVADGSAAPDALAEVRAAYPAVRVVANPAGSTPAGLNRAIAGAAHGVLARLDARALLPPHYLRRAVVVLERTGAASVGGRQAPCGAAPFERAVAAAMTSALGSGGARYRADGPAGAVDTVYLGVFRRAAFEAAGGYDERFERNQDYELNWRLRRAGGVVWFDPALRVAYRPRGTLASLVRQYVDYGRYKRRMLRRHPRAWRARQLAPPLLVLALAASAGLAAAGLTAAAAALPAAWLGALGVAALVAAHGRPGGHAARIALALAAMHLAWGAGFLAGPVRQT